LNLGQKKKRNTRRLLSWVWIYFLYYSGLLRWAQRRIASSSGIVVLTFHRVLPEREFANTNSPPGMVVTASTFKDCLAYIQGQHEIICLSGKQPAWERKSRIVRMGITFDDGWKDTSDVAHLISSELRVPITVFVCPELMGKSSPFWPEQVVRAWRNAGATEAQSMKFSEICLRSLSGFAVTPIRDENRRVEELIARLKEFPSSGRAAFIDELSFASGRNLAKSTDCPLEATMTWEDCRALAQANAQIGSHTQSHEILTGLPPRDAQSELVESRNEIEKRLGVPCLLFAYPNGAWSFEIRNQVSQAKYTLAFINSPGVWERTTDPHLVPRINIWEGLITGRRGTFSPAVFQYSVFWRSFRAPKHRCENPETLSRK